jgi:predicted peptidase
LLAALCCTLGGCAGGSHVAKSTREYPQETGFVQRQVKVDGQVQTVWVFVPTGYNLNTMYPTILFLHGLFEQGNGNGDTNVLSAGLGPVIARNPQNWPFITIFPQSTGNWKGEDREKLALAALDDVQRHYMVDPDRVILAGLSYGGLGVWDIGAANKHRFAALVPVSGFSDLDVAKTLRGINVWAIAAEGDIFVNPQNSKSMCDAIQAAGGRAQFTELPGGSHDCWAQAVEQTDVINWMLTQRRNPVAMLAADGKSVRSGKLRAWNDP